MDVRASHRGRVAREAVSGRQLDPAVCADACVTGRCLCPTESCGATDCGLIEECVDGKCAAKTEEEVRRGHGPRFAVGRPIAISGVRQAWTHQGLTGWCRWQAAVHAAAR